MLVVIMLKEFVFWLRVKFGTCNMNCHTLGFCSMALKHVYEQFAVSILC